MAELAVATATAIGEWLRVKVNHGIATAMRVSRSGLSDQQAVARARSEKMSLNNYALAQAYVLMAVTGLGYLALTWSTVVLLGGFVTSLGKKDFWCLTSISMVQAARIFNDSGDNLFPIFLNLTQSLGRKVFANPVGGLLQKWARQHSSGHNIFTILCVQLVLYIVQILSIPVLVVVLIVGALYVLGPVACIALSVWRLVQRDYGDTSADKANLVPALIIFYCLVICQCVLYFLWHLIDDAAMWVVILICEECRLPEKWGRIIVVDYLYDTRVKCWRDPASIDGRNLINYAVDLVDSESQKDYLSGARVLDIFIQLEADVRSLLLPSRARVQKLIDTLGWRSSNRELREVVARIVAYLAGDIHLSQFPGATRCISSLLDTTLPYWNNQQEPSRHSPVGESKTDASTDNKGSMVSSVEMLISAGQRILISAGLERLTSADQKRLISDVQKRLISPVQQRLIFDSKERLISSVKEIEEYEPESVRYQGRLGSKEDCWNELILQGLAILERLAFDQHNCSDICSTPDLLPNIMAPLYSETLTQDIKVSALADVANGSLKVVQRLIRAPKWIGKSNLVHDISSSKQALSNLESFLRNSAGQELQMRAIEILTELVMLTEPEEHSSTNLSIGIKENLINTQLQIFLDDDEGREEKLRVTAGKSLALLFKIKTISKFIMEGQDKEDLQNSTADRRNEILESTKNNIIVRLNETIDANNIRYRTIALEILENLCTHCTLGKDYVKKTLLPKVLKEVLAAIKRDHPKDSENKYTPWGRLLQNLVETANAIKALFAIKKHEDSQAISGPGVDVENQATSGPGDDKKKQRSGQIKSPDQPNEDKNAKMEFLEALLSLTYVICDKLITADDFNDVVQKSSIREVRFVGTLQAIVKENREARADCLRIVKLCGQIAVLMLQRRQVTARLKLCLESLREASEIMSDLESSMLFAGTDYGVKKTARPLLSELVEKARKLLGYK